MRSETGRNSNVICARLRLIALAAHSCLTLFLLFVGGLFSDNEWDESVQNAFKYAVYRLNHDRTILPKTKVEAYIEKVSSNDSFRASKKGEYVYT